MLSEKCLAAVQEAVNLAAADGTTIVALVANPAKDETALISNLPEGNARAILKLFIKETEMKVSEVKN